jgi:hypothetical protein
LEPALYALLKYGAYAAWCGVGLRFLALQWRRRVLAAAGFGLLRLAMGIGFGIGIWILAMLMYGSLREDGSPMSHVAATAATYAAVYVPVRWIEWSLLEVAMNRKARSLRGWWAGPGGRSRLWRLGGIAISCAADVPLFLAFRGLPLGRIMC